MSVGSTGLGGGLGGGTTLAVGSTTSAVAAAAQQVGILPRTGSSVWLLALISIGCGVAVFLSQLYTQFKKNV